jgi:hypothetical protein
MLEADHRPKQMGEQTTTGICSPISHQKLASAVEVEANLIRAAEESGRR